MVCASLFVVIRYSFVERAGPTIFIRGHSLGVSDFLCMHKIVRRARRINVHARRMPDMRRERWTNAQYTRSTRSVFVVMFVGRDVANTQRTQSANLWIKVGCTTMHN